MTAVATKPGTAVVVRETGEEMVIDAPFDMATFLADIKNPTHVAQQNALAAAYDAACHAIIGPNDIQVEGNREFKKKSAWRKLARYFTISTRVVRVDREYLVSGDFLSTVIVEASAPWGQRMEATGACCTDEATGRRVITVADAIATAETRATNRATSNLIAMGEVSAEEMGDREPRSVESRQATAPTKAASDKKMPFGKHKGELLSQIVTTDLQSTVAWCVEKDAAKFKDLIDACRSVIASRGEQPEPREPEESEFHDETDDLPF